VTRTVRLIIFQLFFPSCAFSSVKRGYAIHRLRALIVMHPFINVTAVRSWSEYSYSIYKSTCLSAADACSCTVQKTEDLCFLFTSGSRRVGRLGRLARGVAVGQAFSPDEPFWSCNRLLYPACSCAGVNHLTLPRRSFKGSSFSNG
jgi:hypothetical protein